MNAKRGLNNNDLISMFVGLLVFLLTFTISGFYTAGDQLGYHSAYSIIRGVDISFGFELYKSYISTVEPVHYLISAIGSNFLIDKNLYYGFINGVLAVYIVRWMQNLGVSYIFTLPFIFTNYYVLVLYLAAERLKLSVLFLMLAAVLLSNKHRISALFFALLSHMTIIILISGRFFEYLITMQIENRKEVANLILKGIVLLAVMLMLFVFFGEYLLWKSYQYYSIADNTFSRFLPTFSCFSLSIYYAKGIKRPIVFFLPIFLAFIFFGGARVNMFAYFAFLYFALPVNSGVNFGTIVSSTYLTFKSCAFLYNVFTIHQGF
ncbi:hypothetical protein [Lentilitoribacter sp. EG35]|uniref:hypothetical protein n=1 Tax=Lentilitoribacter sp. EG35 TaxID=3234192 RepID=UPI0034600376